MFVVKASTGNKEVMRDTFPIAPLNFERYVRYRGHCKCKNSVQRGKAIYSSFITFADDSDFGLDKACKDEAKVVKGGQYTTDVINGLLVVVKKKGLQDGSDTSA